MKYIYSLLALTAVSHFVFAQSPNLLKDINKHNNGSSIITGAGNYTLVNGITFFTADDGVHGIELWKTDGTEAGTVLVKDIYPGIQTSYPRMLTNVNGTLFFTAVESYSTNMELWKSDGTEAGTVMVKDIAPGSNPSEPKFLTDVNGTLFFKANAFAPGGSELWKSDGTEAGTVMVKDIIPGANSSNPINLLNVNGTLFFAALSSVVSNSSYHLWKSDGTAAGTVRVKQVSLGVVNSSPVEKFVAINGTLFFQGNDGINGKELWKSDGTDAGTIMVKDINTAGESSPAMLTVVDSTLYFMAADGSEGTVRKLWKTNGTPEGTIVVTDTAARRISANNAISFNGSLFFSGTVNDSTGSELWKTDGTPEGTVMVKDAAPGAGNSNPYMLTKANGSLYFLTFPDTLGLWKTDGTADGTIKIQASTYLTDLDNLYSNGSMLYFTYKTDSIGTEPWQTDGTAAGTVVLKDVNIVNSGSSIYGFTVIGNTAFFVADDGIHGSEVWKTDGTPAGTQMLKDILPSGGSSPAFLTNVNGTLFFTAQVGNEDWRLWKTDGTAEGTVLVGNTNDANTCYYPQKLTNVNGTLFFTGHSTVYGDELWKSDGTDDGTMVVKDITPSGFSSLNLLTNVNGTLFFTKHDGVIGSFHSTLWKSDGTPAGTMLVKNIPGGGVNGNVMYEGFTGFDGKLYFSANDGIHGPELWTSDGTEAGTMIFKEFVPGATGSYPNGLGVIGNRLYFGANNGTNPNTGMYRTDGTAEGTIAIANGMDSGYFYNQEQFTLVDSSIFFRANGLDIWKMGLTDTAAVWVKSVPYTYTPALPEPRPSFLTAANGILFFNAADNVLGQELWKSDGTAQGTLSFDIVPGLGNSTPKYLTQLNNSLLFIATDPLRGEELWIVKMEPFVWTGNVSTAWETPGNWSTNEIPSASSVVMIPAGRPRYPQVSVSTEVQSIHCAEGSAVTVLPGVTITLLK